MRNYLNINVLRAKRTFCVRNLLMFSKLQRGARGYRTPGLGWGATLKNFFAYFSASVSYVLFV